ncbi:hypothetical protein [Sediminivirga luteola]|uniref:SnoaL-like protein n=1 Tax=Sediminivirga luteola TaxID=1774748 RepID=A0A8J2TV20_9MICO|nr:hypothetical protein [Sediminivirga luteola]MCI2264655.1 hypothetical protein [Sediminivirga luteola]GGA02711.1 hypothetical protein GCM10011333_01620 [Sediminivirga luteola]
MTTGSASDQLRQQVPAAVLRVIEHGSGAPDPELLAGFTAGAVVQDDGRTHSGRAAIASWLAEASTAFDYTSTLIGYQPGRAAVRIEGNFPGGVADLTYAFDLDEDGRITRLTIG